MKYYHALLVLLTSIVVSCKTTVPPSTANYASYDKIQVGPGPEDIDIDSITNPAIPRLLASCGSRRAEYATIPNNIWAVDLRTNKATIIPRIGEPEGFIFNPHGFSITKQLANNKPWLWVINHGDASNQNKNSQSITVYEVTPTNLVFVKNITSEVIESPNDIYGLSDGTCYFTNDFNAPKHNLQLLLGRKTGSIVYYDGRDCKKVATKLPYSNGIIAYNNELYVSCILKKAFYKMPILKNGTLGNKTRLAKLKGIDNISITDGTMYIASHPNLVAFAKHFKNKKKHSPTVIYKFNPIQPTQATVVYSNKGEQISAGSGAIYFKNSLYIAQVFEDYILKASNPIK